MVVTDQEMIDGITEDMHQRRFSEFGAQRIVEIALTRQSDSVSAKLKVENLHYDLTEEDLDVCYISLGT